MRIKGKKSYYLYQQNFLEIKIKRKLQNINKSIKNNGKQKHDLTFPIKYFSIFWEKSDQTSK